MLHIHKPYGAAAVGKQQTVAVCMWRRGPVCVCHGGFTVVAIHSPSEARLHVCNRDSSQLQETKKEINLEHTREIRDRTTRQFHEENYSMRHLIK